MRGYPNDTDSEHILVVVLQPCSMVDATGFAGRAVQVSAAFVDLFG